MGEGERGMDPGHSWSSETKETDLRTVAERQGTPDEAGGAGVTDRAQGTALSLGPLSVPTCSLTPSASPSVGL